MNAKLIAPCGMNCAVCLAYLREKNKCPGCRLIKVGPKTRVRCKIKICSKQSKFCFQCKDYPCFILKRLDKRYRKKYSMSMLENLENIKSLGIKKFIKNEEKRWKCSCGGTICVHSGLCVSCGKKI